jgi:quercetin dioxygenase-like cupin family protein
MQWRRPRHHVARLARAASAAQVNVIATSMGARAMAITGTPTTGQVLRHDLLTAALGGGRVVDRVEIKRIELAPGQSTGPHRHPCPVVGHILSGSIQFQIEGRPAKTLRAGDAFFEPANLRIRSFDNSSPREPATFVAFYLLGVEDRDIIEMLA